MKQLVKAFVILNSSFLILNAVQAQPLNQKRTLPVRIAYGVRMALPGIGGMC